MKKKNMIWRDDDISYITDIKKFAQVHDIFNKYGVTHTIALIAQNIEKNPELIAYIKEHDIDVQIHCWDHLDMTQNTEKLEVELLKSMEIIGRVFGDIPSTVYPPWNRTNEVVNEIAESIGLKVSAEKISLHQYIKTNGDVAEDVVNFHYWAYEDAMLLEAALKIQTS